MSIVSYTPKETIPGIIDGLRATYRTGTTKDLTFRKQQLRGLLRFLEENTEAINQVLYKDLHKHKIESNTAEISPIVDDCKYMLKNLDRLAKPSSPPKRFKMNASDKTYVRKEPKGVVLVIGAWNYPVNLLLLPVVGAIAAGNCVVIKPSEVAEHTADLMGRVLPNYLDKRAYAVVNGGVEETTVILEQKLDHIFYTGNGAVGRIVMTAAAKHLTPVTLELGGKSPAVVTSSADMSLTAHRLLWGKFYNNGQTCVAPDYVLVEEGKTEDLVAAFKKVLHEFYGKEPQKSSSYGRIINHRQFDRLKAILDNIDQSRIVGGETDRDDLFIAPTLITSVDPNDPIMQDEIFGPILPVISVKDLDQAVDIINARDEPLAMYIFSNKSSEYNFILDKTNSGGVCVNDTLMHLQELSLPFGGVGPSGQGAYHGDKSFETFTHERSTMVKSTGMESMMKARYPPYSDDKNTLMSVLVYGLPSSAGAKIKTFGTVCSAAWNIFTQKESKL
ncbi:Aldehyde/histidinol dehydrogenase [Syncephalastrum racemosum]|uniref:Aldehyde dehydrogenase n=1 Tax=Syncephalastrum racemosum TaxID=13706 RepID=A0A1X2HQ75_SYNRA|nr:Aldehyde/histidinol dehydrogenase [Syncephalastrum racemosum]